MNIIGEKFYPRLGHGGDPGGVAERLFLEHDFGDIVVADYDGAESTERVGTPFAESSIRFYAEPEGGEGDSIPMKYVVEFTEKGARASHYA